ncbi:MAG: hypothetical protein IT423_10730 [Pirellulaceae bacterium]|nr:hypothetical protein [Pirellulaceae bacterium]
MVMHKQVRGYFQVISRIDGFEVGKCCNQYYIKHPRGLIDWLHVDLDEALASPLDDVPHHIVGQIREVLQHEITP